MSGCTLASEHTFGIVSFVNGSGYTAPTDTAVDTQAGKSRASLLCSLPDATTVLMPAANAVLIPTASGSASQAAAQTTGQPHSRRLLLAIETFIDCHDHQLVLSNLAQKGATCLISLVAIEWNKSSSRLCMWQPMRAGKPLTKLL